MKTAKSVLGVAGLVELSKGAAARVNGGVKGRPVHFPTWSVVAKKKDDTSSATIGKV